MHMMPPMLLTVGVMHMMPMLLTVGVMPSSCMRKRILIIVIGSMLIVIPIGRANLTTFGLILFFSSRHLEVMGSAARLDEVAGDGCGEHVHKVEHVLVRVFAGY